MLTRQKIGDAARLHRSKQKNERKRPAYQRRLRLAPLEERLLLSVVPPNAVTIWNDNFESDAVAPAVVGQKSIHFFDNSTTYPTANKQFSATPVGATGDTVLSFDWCYNSNASNDNLIVQFVDPSHGDNYSLMSVLTPTGVDNWNWSGQGISYEHVATTTTNVWYHSSLTIHSAVGQAVGYYDITITRLSDNAQIASVAHLPYKPPSQGFTTIHLQENQVNSNTGTDVSFDNFSVTASGFGGYTENFESGAYGAQPTGWSIGGSDANADVQILKAAVPLGWNYSSTDANSGLATATAPLNLGLGGRTANFFDNSTALSGTSSVQVSSTPAGATSDLFLSYDWSYNSNTSNDNVVVQFTDPSHGDFYNVLNILSPTGVDNWNFSSQGASTQHIANTTTGVWYHSVLTVHSAVGQAVGYYDITITRLSDNAQIASVDHLPYLPPSKGFTTIQLQENQVNSNIGTNVSFDNFSVAKPLGLIKASEGVKPGEILSLYGEDMTGTVQVQFVEAGKTVTPVQQDPTGHFVKVIVPSDLQPGAYTVQVQVGGVWTSAPYVLNQADPHWLSETQGYAGLELKLVGRNLDAAEYGGVSNTEIRLVSIANPSEKYSATVVPTVDKVGNIIVNPYAVNFMVPPSIPLGNYHVEVRTNSGGIGTTWVEHSEPLTVVDAPTDPLAIALGVSWAIDFNWDDTHEYNIKEHPDLALHAVGNGTADDFLAIQSAINYVASQGGGVLYFPSGTYAFSSALTLRYGVVLKGEVNAGNDPLTTLHFTGNSGPIISGNSGDAANGRLGFANLKLTLEDDFLLDEEGNMLQNDLASETWLMYLGSTNAQDIFVYNSIIDGSLDNPWVSICAITANERVLFAQNTVKGYLANLRGPEIGKYLTVRNNIFDYTVGVTQLCASNFIFEENEITGHPNSVNNLHGLAAEPYAGELMSHVYVINNEIAGTEQSAGGEAILSEDPGNNFMAGTVSSATANTITIVPDPNYTNTSQSWATKWQIMIIDGRGMGQFRDIVSQNGNVLTLNKAWDVVPNSTSKFSVLRAASDLVVYHNTVINCTGPAVMFFFDQYDNIAADNTSTNSWGISVWGRMSVANVAEASYFCAVKRNTVTGGSSFQNNSWIGATANQNWSPMYAVLIYGAEFKSNLINKDGFTEEVDDLGSDNVPVPAAMTASFYTFYDDYLPTDKGIVATLFERNQIINSHYAFYLTKGVDSTLFKGNALTSVPTVFFDRGSTNTITVNDPSTVNLTGPGNNVLFLAPDLPANIPLSATAADSDGTVTSVSFYNGTNLIGTDNNGTDGWSVLWTVPAWSYGDYVVTARATDNSGAISASMALNLTIAGAPTNQAVDVGQTVTFTVASLVGSAPLSSYQWQKFTAGNWTDVAGATGAYYTTPAVAQADNGTQYRVIVSKTGGTAVTSPPATLSVNYGSEIWWKLDDASGSTTFTDSDNSGTNWGGTVSSATFNTSGGILNGALSFSGATTSYARTTSTSSTALLANTSTSQLTLSAWVNLSSAETSNTGGLFFSRPYSTSSSPYNYQFGYNSGTTPTLFFSLTGGTTASPTTFTVTTPSGMSRGAWHHVAATVNVATSSIIVFVDGVAVATGASVPSVWSVTTTAQPLMIGSRHTSGNTTATSMTGMMDNVRVYTHALNALAIAEQARAPVVFWKLDEPSGNASDSSGNGYTGTTALGPTWQSSGGMFNGALQFDGTDSYLQSPTTASLLPALKYTGAELTLATWVYINPGETKGAFLSKPRSTTTTQYNYQLGLDPAGTGKIAFSLQGSSTTYTLLTDTALSTNSWHHVAATVNSSRNMTIYVDGVAVKTATHNVTAWSSSDGSKPLVIGSTFNWPSASSHPNETLSGKLDNVRLYDRVLSGTDIHWLAIDPPVVSATTSVERESPRKSIGAAAKAHVDAALAALGIDAYSHAWDDEPLWAPQNRGARRSMVHRSY